MEKSECENLAKRERQLKYVDVEEMRVVTNDRHNANQE